MLIVSAKIVAITKAILQDIAKVVDPANLDFFL